MAEKTQMTPDQARAYIAIFCKHTLPGCDMVTTNAGEIWLDKMTDDEALFVASEFKRMEIEAVSNRREDLQ